MGFSKIYNRMERSFKKMPIWFHLLVLLAIIFILLNIYKQTIPKREGFIDQREKFVVKKGIDLYDDFYVNIYDELFFKEIANQYEVGSIMNITKPTTESNILVIGSGTGHIANEFHKDDIKVTGIDESAAMVNYAKKEYPKVQFKVADPLKAMIFNQEQFTHILCLNLNFYQYKNKNVLLQNIYNWLRPGGFFVVQLVDKNKFDPVVPAGKPFVMVNPQKFAKNRITTSEVVFNNFNYKSDFQTFPNDFVQFREIFKDTENGSNKVRENIHKLWVPPKQQVISECKEIGFIVYAEVDLLMAQMEYQYLYVFQKPE
ncbi:class I SAM-dependent methyltransferase [Flavobacteriaceae bacterium]|nr:class I SAM-dependent methyltransferase [Flavobacteriaceae bacterium]